MTVISPDIIRQAQMGSIQAWKALAQVWYPRMYRLAYRYFNDSEMAQEVSQQTMVQAWENVHQLREPAQFSAWMYRLLWNQCHQMNRKVAQQQRQQQDLDNLRNPLSSSDADEPLLQQERERLVKRALTYLPSEQRQVVLLKEYEQLTFKEIAQVLAISENTAKSRMYYALKALRKRFDQWNITSQSLLL
ncbi:MAG: RNA polymerase sigma factor [Bacteroidota bacterium]